MKVQNLITQKNYLSEPVKSITYTYTYCDAFAVVAHTFEITTASDKLYLVSFSQDFNQVRDYLIEQKKEAIAK